MNRSMSPRSKLSAPLAALTLLTAGLSAQTTAILGPSNAAYLEGLWRAGYIEYAQKVGDLVAASNLPEAEKKAVDAVYTRLKIAISQRDQDALGRRDLVLKVIADKSAQVKAGDVKADATSFLVLELVEQYRLLADALVEALAKEQDPEKAATLRKDSEATFKTVEAEFAARKVETEKLKKDDEPGTDVPYMAAFYGLGRLHYYHSLLYPADSQFAKHEVELALSALEDFELDFSDTLTGIEAKLTQALCHKRLGNIEAAMGACDDAFKLYERFEKNSDGTYKVDKEAADVIAAAALQKSLFLDEQKEYAKIVELGKQYFKLIPKAMDADQGPAVLAAMAKAHINLGENEPATQIAKQLIEFDPKGRWGARGQELIGMIGGGSKIIGVAETVRLAESLAGQRDYEGALRNCREVLLRANPDTEQKQIVDAMMIVGVVYALREWFHEASVAYDEVVRRYPKSEAAPEALWREINCYMQINKTDNTATNKVAVYKQRIAEKSRQLKSDYPNDPRVPALVLLDGDQLEGAGKFLEAAKVYEAISPDSTVYYEARYKAAASYLGYARSLANASREKEAEPFTAKALEGFQAVINEIDTRLPAITDKTLKNRLEGVQFNSSISLAGLYLSGQPRPADAENVLAKIKGVDDEKQAQMLTSLRIRIKVAQGQIDDAAAMMEEALNKAAEKGIKLDSLLATCRSLATSLDNLAAERSKKKERQAASLQWRKAIAFYLKCAQNASPGEATQIAERLSAIGMIDNNVGEKVQSWYEVPSFRATSFDAWNAALQIYQPLAEDKALNYKGQIGYARVLGFLGKWNECEAELTKLFQTEKITSGNQLDRGVVARKTELVTAFIEWSFALDNATGGDEKGRRAKATNNFVCVLASVQADSPYWWYAKYGQVKTLFERADYEGADVTLKSVERTNPDFDGERFGLKVRFNSLKLEIRAKIK
jgi:tetratricopeptide (TPR) repeat protein